MRTRYADVVLLSCLTLLLLVLPGCDFVGDVLEFSFWVMLIIFLIVIAIAWAVVRWFKRKI